MSSQQGNMFDDTKIVEMESKTIGQAKDILFSTYQSQSSRNKLIIVIAVLIVIGLIIWFIGRNVAGLMTTPLGIMLLVITIISVGLYLFMRSKGVGFKSLSGGFIEVILIMFLLMVYMGSLDYLQEIFLQFFPIILLAMIGWVGYRWWTSTDDATTKQGVAILIVCILIGFPLFEAFVVPYTTGQPLSINAEISRDDTGKWYCFVEMKKYTFLQSMSTQLNPYAISIAETSNWMWSSGNTQEKAYVDIKVVRESPPDTIFSETHKSIYVGYNDNEGIFAMARLPVQTYEHYIGYVVSIRVYNDGGITLASDSYMFLTD